MQVFLGTYSQYRATLEAQKVSEEKPSEARVRQAPLVEKPRVSPEEKRRKARLKELEDQIALLEGHLATLSGQLENPPSDPAKVQRLGGEYVRVQNELERMMEEWEGLHQE